MSEISNDDYYGALGVPSTASQAEIKTAFRKLASQHHPDRNRDSKDSEKKFKEITEAEAVLSDSERRKEYDRRPAQQPYSATDNGKITRILRDLESRSATERTALNDRIATGSAALNDRIAAGSAALNDRIAAERAALNDRIAAARAPRLREQPVGTLKTGQTRPST
jgi:DnaJ-class molecular chaperone